MDFLQPKSWDDALAAKAERPDAVPISGGTDLMVDVNFDRRRPDALLDPDAIAQNYLNILRQPRSAWTWEVELRPWVERF